MNKKITCISDTHGMHERVETTGGDVLIFAGDWQGRHWDNPSRFVDWLSDQDYGHTVVVLGNHDSNYEGIRVECNENKRVHLLHDSGIEIYGLKFYGTPWTNQFENWYYMAGEKALGAIFSLVPHDTNVLVSHSPAFGVRDCVEYICVGSRPLKKEIETLTELNLHVFGHIHEGYGETKGRDYTAINASQLDEDYKLVNKPVDIIL